MTHAMEHCHRPWWKRPPFWFVGIAAVALIVVAVLEQTGRPAAMPYNAFLDQVEAGNVVSVSFQGTEISGRFKRPGDGADGAAGAGQDDSFRSRLPDFGDASLIAELRKRHVAIEVASPSAWAWLLGRVPWPMLILVGAILVAGSVRVLRGGKAQPGPAASALPAHGMIGLISGLFTKQRPAETPPKHNHDESKGG